MLDKQKELEKKIFRLQAFCVIGILFAYDAADIKYPLNENLGKLEKILDPKMFFRINRSEMINLKFIERLEPYFNDRLAILVKNSKVKFITSTNRTPNLRKWIGYS